ncbi:hypothetical protein LTR10_016783 [Elasticomyces elasticus]|uniref:Uncharacterized protein n=1 Tax=Exophiala sideris TaxID=1016849 RepID=A0ABR0JMX6_9EURO|nr:hypothetical protein LTR10_016783 [Elasticomyces elasticus]KAK5037786.1 hypothetical protein LTS07_001253 [Exophiala sideris]KAK5043769.1 hypothetical protein LTR13_000123 [Exophiala sideris]KAK5067268.1 hypothetical protein LTR69_001255 [Exophiala sideris]KAK5182601.1 hypothetical protein LTR44_004992 [Eurotiomycetes sp. CCFEE 6388]
MESPNSATMLQDDGGQGIELSTRQRRARRGQKRCSHPACGKYGHTIDRCWIVHPELRPGNVRNCAKLTQGHVSGNHTARKTSPTHFRFLDLPLEIRNQIYDEVYEQGYPLTIKTQLLEIKPWSPAKTLHCRMDMPNLHLASKQVYQESGFFRQKPFNGHLRFDWPIYELYSDPVWDALRSEVTELTFYECNNHRMWEPPFADYHWADVPTAFPNISEIHVEWTTFQDKYKPGSNSTYSKAWRSLWQPGAMQAFYDGEKDDCCCRVFHRNLKRLWNPNMWNGRHCKFFVTTTLKWLDSKNKPVFVQSIKFMLLKGWCKTLYRRAHRAPRNSAPVSEDW